MKKTQHFEVINKDGLFGHDEKTTTTKPTKWDEYEMQFSRYERIKNWKIVSSREDKKKQISNKNKIKWRIKKILRTATVTATVMYRTITLMHSMQTQLITFSWLTLYLVWFGIWFFPFWFYHYSWLDGMAVEEREKAAPQINRIFFLCISTLVVSWLRALANRIGRVFRDYKMLYILWNNQFFSNISYFVWIKKFNE